MILSFRNKKINGKQKSNIRIIWGVICSVCIVLFLLSFVFVYKLFYLPLGSEDEVLYINIEEGETRQEIADKLVKVGILKYPDAFVWYTKIVKKGNDIKAGNHILNKSMSISQIIENLELLPQDDSIWVTIPEGLRYDEIADRLSEAFSKTPGSIFSEEEFLKLCEDPWAYKGMGSEGILFVTNYLPQGKTAEGFLFPDTYNFAMEAEASQIFDILALNLKSKLEKEILNQIEESGRSLYDVLILASMIEREAFTKEEALMISDILQRRLESGMYLGVDATSLYFLKDWKAELTYQELNDPNPYNTRKSLGLPPTPISNPGIMTIEAVLNPVQNDYLYYLHDSSGVIHYAKTNAEHEKNKSI